MSQETSEFRDSVLVYFKQPNSSVNQLKLVEAANKIRQKFCTGSADDYFPCLFKTLQSSLKDIKVSPESHKQFQDLLKKNRGSDLNEVHFSGIVLEPVSFFLHPSKTNLKEIIVHLEAFQNKLTNEETQISLKKLYGSFFISDLDEKNIQAKKSIIDDLLQFTIKKVEESSHDDSTTFSIEYKIDFLEEEKCKSILFELAKRINQILNDKCNRTNRHALMAHSFNDGYIFTFLAKLVKTIKEILGLKTSAEYLLENIVTEVHKLSSI